MTDLLKGVIVPLLTPFTPDGEAVDVPALRQLVERLVAAGVHGVIANAGTSEFFHMDDAERRLAAEVVVEQAAKRIPVIVGAGAIATRHAIAWAKHAESIGADGLLIVPPYYSPVAKPAIFKHFAAISEAVSTPIMLYNNPFVCGVLLDPDDIAQLKTVSNIRWIKLTTRVLEHIALLRDTVGDGVPIFEGWDTLVLPAMVLGAAGPVSAPANVMPQLVLELWRDVHVTHDLAAAQALDQCLTRFFNYCIRERIFVSALKEISGMQGHSLGPVRAPHESMNDAQRARVRQFASELGVLPG